MFSLVPGIINVSYHFYHKFLKKTFWMERKYRSRVVRIMQTAQYKSVHSGFQIPLPVALLRATYLQDIQIIFFWLSQGLPRYLSSFPAPHTKEGKRQKLQGRWPLWPGKEFQGMVINTFFLIILLWSISKAWKRLASWLNCKNTINLKWRQNWWIQMNKIE